MLRRAYVMGITAKNQVAQQFVDGYGGIPIPRPFLGGTTSGFHAAPMAGDEVAVLYEQDAHPYATISATVEPEKMAPVQPGESGQYHDDGRVADFLGNDGSSTLFEDPAGDLVAFDASGNLTMTALGEVSLSGSLVQVLGPATLSQSLTVTGTTTLNGSLVVNSPQALFNAGIFVSGNTVLRGDTLIVGNTTASGSLSLAGNLLVGGTFFAGSSTVSGDLAVSGNATIDGTLTVQQKITGVAGAQFNNNVNMGGFGVVNFTALTHTNFAITVDASSNVNLAGNVFVSTRNSGTVTATAGAAAGTGGAVGAAIVRGGSNGGEVSVTTGTGGTGVGLLVTVNWTTALPNANYQVHLTQVNGAGSTLGDNLFAAVGTKTTTSFQVYISNTPSTGRSYYFDYLILH